MNEVLRKNKVLTIILGIFVLIIVSITITLMLVPWSEHELPDRLTDEARVDRWLAAKELLKPYNAKIERSSPFTRESAAESTDIIFIDQAARVVRTKALSDKLLSWVSTGGTLVFRVDVLGADQTWASTGDHGQFFPQALGVFARRTPSRTSSGYVLSTRCRSDTVSVEFEQSKNFVMQVTSTGRNVVFSTEHASRPISTIAENEILSTPVGRGSVYFVKGFSAWTNQFIDCYDHAYVLLRMLGIDTWLPDLDLFPQRTIWIMPITSMPPLYRLIWENSRSVLLGLMIAFIVALFVWNIRLSPPIYEHARPRRSAFEYATGAANFAWIRGDTQPFFVALRSLISEKRSAAEMRRNIDQTATALNVSHQEVLDAMNSKETSDEKSLILRVRILGSLYQTVNRKKLFRQTEN